MQLLSKVLNVLSAMTASYQSSAFIYMILSFQTGIALWPLPCLLFSRNRVILEAEAESEAIQVKGEAEAYAIEAKAKAEAEQMAKKADAWKDYQDAAMIDMILETLPKVSWLLMHHCLVKQITNSIVDGISIWSC